ncbi:hypothetical protein N0V93_006312 [Gnomoniopsis smithogilvyi]|uniref:Uncharacterized protein n=1 Tax=Gnomoniopsis smithogilvyi TaxID=1191159 RepID=A0A9W9CVG9_9PEZI|nr:hypothetical protein N0V93_006312 [Gnomoniopsis smithogilvyi]
MTNIFCSLYSTGLKARDMTWEGEIREQFEIVVTGSNVFNKDESRPPKTEWLPQVTMLPNSILDSMNEAP